MPRLRALTAKPVVGIFDASVYAAVMLLPLPREEEGEEKDKGEEEKGEEGEKGEKKKEEKKKKKTFGIVSTGDAWKGILGDAVREEILGRERAGVWFGGVETCGLDAGELHGDEEVERRVREATGRLVRGKEGGGGGEVGVVVLGCAGMVGMEGWVRGVAGEGVRVVDGVKAGVGALQGLVRGAF